MPLRHRYYLSGVSPYALAAATMSVFAVMTSGDARADCPPVTTSGDVINCAGYDDFDGVASNNFDNIFVNLPAGSAIVTVGTGIYLVNSNDSTVTLSGDGSVSTQINQAHAVRIDGDNATISLFNAALITTAGDLSYGAYIGGDAGEIALRGAGQIETQGGNTIGAFISGDDGLIFLADGSTILTHGNVSEGADINGNNGIIQLTGFSSILTEGDESDGAEVIGDSGLITLNDDAQITTSGFLAYGAHIEGADGTISLHGDSTIQTNGIGGDAAHGARIEGDGGEISLSGTSHIETQGDVAVGAIITGNDGEISLEDGSTIETASEGSFGALITGDNGVITLSDTASVTTAGANAHGTYIAGNDGIVSLNDGSSIETAVDNSFGIVITGDGGEIILTDTASVATSGNIAFGIAITGDGGTVTIGTDATVKTQGDAASAVVFRSGNNSLTNAGLLQAADAYAVWGANDGNDIINNSGTITGGAGTAMSLLGGDDRLTLNTGSVLNGLSDGGDGFDFLTLDGVGTEDDVFQNFETLQVLGADWSLSEDSTFSNQILIGGALRVDGTLTSPQTLVIGVATLGGSGTLASAVNSAGTISPGDANAVGTLTVDGTFIQTGGAFNIEFDDNGMDRLNVTGTATINGAPAINLTALNGATGFNGTFLHADGGITGTFGAINYTGNGAATLVQTTNDADLTDGVTPSTNPVGPTAVGIISVDGTPVVAGNFAALQAGLDYLDMVTETQLDQLTQCRDDSCAVSGGRRIWAGGFGHFGHENAQDGNQAYNYHTAGAAIGGELAVANGSLGALSLGGSLGYGNVVAKLNDHAARTESDAEFLALYATYEAGPFFLTGIASGGLQQFDLSRKVATAGGHDTARAETDSWQAGGSVQTGLKVDLGQGWRLTPTAGVAYQHLDVDGYAEHGAGLGNVDIGDQESDALRLNAQLKLAKTVALSQLSLIPHAYLGVAEQINFGGGVDGSFTTGDDFALSQRNDDRVIGLAGAGVDFNFASGVSTNIDYRTQLSGDHQDHAIIAGVAFEW